MPALPDVERFVTSSGARVYRLPCEAFPGFVVYAYCVLGAGPPTLVDSGSGHGDSTRHLLSGIAAIRSRFGEPVGLEHVRRLLLTHGHIDHFGGARAVFDATAADVGMHELDRSVLTAHRSRVAVASKAMRSFLQQAGVEPRRHDALMDLYEFSKRHVQDVPVRLDLADGGELDGMRFLHVPGHCPGQVCIRLGDTLLAADHVLARTTPHMAPESIMPYTGLGHYLESLARLAAVPGIALALGGHEEPIPDLYARIDEIRASHARKLQRVLSIVGDAGPCTIDRVTEAMYPRVEGFHVLLALEEVGAHVEHLHQRGRLVVDNIDELEREPNPAVRYRVE